MKSKNKKTARKRSLTALIAAAVIVAVLIPGVLVIAEFTRSDRAKRVIGTYGETGNMFSSNHLTDNTSLNLNAIQNNIPTDVGTRRTIYTSDPDIGASTQITVCNYTQGNRTRRYPADIPYNLYAALVKITGNSKVLATPAEIGTQSVTISFNGNDYTLNSSNNSISTRLFTSTLDATESMPDVLDVSFSAGFGTSESGVWLYVLAQPVGSLTGIQPLDAVFRTAVRGKSTNNGWQGYFNESGALGDVSGAEPEDLDGFRYTIEGTGKGTFTIMWDESKLHINDVFIIVNSLKHGSDDAAIESDGRTYWKKIVFDVDSDTKSRYDTQFYYASQSVYDATLTWDEIKSFVEFSFELDSSE